MNCLHSGNVFLARGAHRSPRLRAISRDADISGATPGTKPSEHVCGSILTGLQSGFTPLSCTSDLCADFFPLWCLSDSSYPSVTGLLATGETYAPQSQKLQSWSLTSNSHSLFFCSNYDFYFLDLFIFPPVSWTWLHLPPWLLWEEELLRTSLFL